ncbi:MAG: thioredoxin [Candidatus Krumholzibacteriota bacterium]|nr:thioredoxin [Candidatus Krumholzibacteriota bacterium]
MATDVKMVKVSDNDFEDKVIDPGTPAVVDFWATWCAPCRELDVVLNEMASEYGSKVSFYKVDVNESNRTASKYSVRSIPMLLFFRNGEIVDHAVGSITRETLEGKLRSLAETA